MTLVLNFSTNCLKYVLSSSRAGLSISSSCTSTLGKKKYFTTEFIFAMYELSGEVLLLPQRGGAGAGDGQPRPAGAQHLLQTVCREIQDQSHQFWRDRPHQAPGDRPHLRPTGELQPRGWGVPDSPLQPHGHLQAREQEVHPVQEVLQPPLGLCG